jgi:hypothetical protein
MSVNVTTPSGIEIVYAEKPRRHYLVNGTQVPSVTQALSILDKPALSWWGQSVGVDGVLQLYRAGLIDTYVDRTAATALLKKHKLTVHHVRDAGGVRGASAHNALVRLCEGYEVLPEDYPNHERGYVCALLKWWREAKPNPLQWEDYVASVDHGYAGRFDLLCAFPDNAQWDGKTVRLDLKTAKGIYPDNFLQTEAYELAALESGYKGSDVRAVLRLGEDGTWEARESNATWQQFVAVLGAYNALQDLKKQKAAA